MPDTILLGGLRPAALSGSEEGTETSVLFMVGLVEAFGGGGVVGEVQVQVQVQGVAEPQSSRRSHVVLHKI